MSLQHHLPDQAVRPAPQASFFRENPQQMRIAMAIPDHEDDETRAYEGAGDPQEAIDGGRQRIEKTLLQPFERAAMLAAVPSLRAFAISLSRNVDRADDLVQETLLRATANIGSFRPGTSMPAWLFTILRNQFRSEYRKRRHEGEDADGTYTESLTSAPGQHSHLELKELACAVAWLSVGERGGVVFVGVSAFS